MSGLRLRNIQELLDIKAKQCDTAEVQQKPHEDAYPPTTPIKAKTKTQTTTKTITNENINDECIRLDEITPQKIKKKPRNRTTATTTKTRTTTTTTTTKSKEIPNQMRIDNFFKSASKTFVVNSITTTTTTTTTGKKLTKSKNKKRTPPKRRKLDLDEASMTSSTTTATTISLPDSDCTYKPTMSSSKIKTSPVTRRQQQPRKTPQKPAETETTTTTPSPDVVIDLCDDSDNDVKFIKHPVKLTSSTCLMVKTTTSLSDLDIPFVSIPPTVYQDDSRHLIPAAYISRESELATQVPDLRTLFPDGSNWSEQELDCMELEAEKKAAALTSTTTKSKRARKPCPSYKIIRGTSFAVDAFQFGDILGVTHYFLTHFHSDHYVGLLKSFAHPIYMSQITANLLRVFVGVDDQYIHVLPMNETVKVMDVEVTAIDANHCPGAVMLVFKLRSGRCILHTGDFRACHEMESEPIFWNNKIDLIYLDTTYLNRKTFCTQFESIEMAKAIITKFRNTHGRKRILYVCGAYLIGKERFWCALAEEYGLSVWTEDYRRKALATIRDQEILKYVVDDPYEAELHLISMQKVNYWRLADYFNRFQDRFDCVLGIRPSGWEKPPSSKARLLAQINVVGIEYSEHSSTAELERFVRFLKPRDVVSTVPLNQSELHITAQIPQKWYKYEKLQIVPRNYQPSITNYVRMQMESRNNIRRHIQNTVGRSPSGQRLRTTPALTAPRDLSSVPDPDDLETSASQSPPTVISTTGATATDETIPNGDDVNGDDDNATIENPTSKATLNLSSGSLNLSEGGGDNATRKWVEHSAFMTCRRLFNNGDWDSLDGKMGGGAGTL